MEGGSEKEAKVNQGCTALIWAIHNGHTNCAQLLMDSGANKDAKDERGSTALMFAATKGNTDHVRLLIDGGADKNATDSRGMVALMYATVRGHIDCARLLIARGADKEAKDENGMTALDFAKGKEKGKLDMFRFIGSCSEANLHEMAMDPKKRARFMGRACHNCFKTQTSMLKCSLCLTAHYCSKECQKTDWRLHKATCDRGVESPSPAPSQQQSLSSADSLQQHDDEHVDASVSGSGLEANEACHSCSKLQSQIAERLKRCDRCRSVAYCSVQCQRSDWRAHKKACTKSVKPSE
jgi:hypothetical protein